MSLPAKFYDKLTIKQLEDGTQIKIWGRMARAGNRLGYGLSMLDDGKPGDVAMSQEDFDRITALVDALPRHAHAAIRMIYVINPGGLYKVAPAAIKLGTTRDSVEDARRSGLDTLYGVLCLRICA